MGKYERQLKTKVDTMNESQLRKAYRTARGKNKDAIRTRLTQIRAEQAERQKLRQEAGLPPLRKKRDVKKVQRKRRSRGQTILLV